MSFARRTFSLAELTEDVPVRNVSTAADERDRAGQTGRVVDDVVAAPLSVGEGNAEAAGTDPSAT